MILESGGGTATVTIEEGATVTLENTNSSFTIGAGVHMVMEPGSSFIVNAEAADQTTAIHVYGTLDILGDEYNRVLLTANGPTFSCCIQYWDGIKVYAGGDAYLDYAILQQSDGIQYFDGTWGAVTNSQLRYNKYGIYMEGDADILSIGNVYRNNTYGAHILGGATGTGEHQPQPVFIMDVITDNARGLYIVGTNNINEPDPSITVSVVAFNGTNGCTTLGTSTPVSTGDACNYALVGTWANPNHVMQAKEVYWGYDNYKDVAASAIYDHTDSATKPYVNYGQIFTNLNSSTPEQETREVAPGF